MKEPLYENAHKRTVKDTQEERDKGWGVVKAHGGTKSHMIVGWNINAEATRDGIVMFKIGNEKVYVSLEQVLKYTRWV